LYVENPFCDFVIVICVIGNKKASPDPSERRGCLPTKHTSSKFKVQNYNYFRLLE